MEFEDLINDPELFKELIGWEVEDFFALEEEQAKEVLHTAAVKRVKSQLNPYYRRVSPEVMDYFNSVKAEWIVNGHQPLEMIGRDDRLGENLDNARIHFTDLKTGIFDFFDPQGELDRFKEKLLAPENEKVGELLRATPGEYLKLMIYYLNLSSFGELNQIISSYESVREEVHQARWEDGHDSENDPLLHNPTYFVDSMRPEKLENILNLFNVSDVDSYIKLFIETPYMTPFLRSVNLNLFNHIISGEGVDSVEKLIGLTDDRDLRIALLGNGSQNYARNFKYIKDYFEMNDVAIIKDFFKLENTSDVLNSTRGDNLEVLLSVLEPSSVEEFNDFCLNEDFKKSVEVTTYSPLVSLMDILGLSGEKKKSYFRNMISGIYNSNLQEYSEKLVESLESCDVPENFGDLVFSTMKGEEFSRQNVSCLCDLLESGVIDSSSDISKLKTLQKFTGGFLTSYLSKEVLESSDVNALFSLWGDTIKSFKEGKFDSSNELHKNLEFISFTEISKSKSLKKHLRGFDFDSYLYIFDENRRAREAYYSEEDKFEIECVAEESRLLKDYILKVHEGAKKIGLKTLVVPNLSYGYLPVVPFIDELSEMGIDFLMGAKIGSTESHNNKSIMSSSLLKGRRTNIVDEQPVIVVVDGTNHLMHRDGSGKGARYPDAYQGYLNQVIAINDALGFDKVNYSRFGKSEYDMGRLRETEEFVRAVDLYSHMNGGCDKREYNFEMWNTAGMDLIIRGNRESMGELAPYEPENLHGPSVIFCNVGLLHEQIPSAIKDRYEGYKHIPAYFDDSGRIINFEFGHNEFGVRFINSLEDELKRTFNSSFDNDVNPELVSAMIKYSSSLRSFSESEICLDF